VMIKLLHGDCLKRMAELEAESVNCVVTSPPYYGLRSYLPDMVKLKEDAPEWVLEELERLNIHPVDK